MTLNDTIYALSTPPGNGVAVIRISGQCAEEALKRCFSHKGEYESHMLYYGDVFDEESMEKIDEAMAVLMRKPRSYTAEDCAELHCHGSSAVLGRVLELLSKMGLRQAMPGEFTRRAFENARMDLSQAEAVMDLIHASADAAAKTALEQLQGSISKKIILLQDQLTNLIAQIEAAIDYPEEDWESEIIEEVGPMLLMIKNEISALLAGGAQGQIIREGLKVALVGRPNAGKSTLLNAFLGKDRAIVTDIPGTTRDLIEENISISGLLIRLIDTAGLRESDEIVEKLGVERSKKAIEEADLLLFVLDASQPWTAEDQEILSTIENKSMLCVVNKNDLDVVLDVDALKDKINAQLLMTGFGADLSELSDAIYQHFVSLAPQERPSVLVSNRRHLDALKEALDSLGSAYAALHDADMDCVTIDLRRAWHSLGDISGLSADEAIVDRIFSTFCLGK